MWRSRGSWEWDFHQHPDGAESWEVTSIYSNGRGRYLLLNSKGDSNSQFASQLYDPTKQLDRLGIQGNNKRSKSKRKKALKAKLAARSKTWYLRKWNQLRSGSSFEGQHNRSSETGTIFKLRNMTKENGRTSSQKLRQRGDNKATQATIFNGLIFKKVNLEITLVKN